MRGSNHSGSPPLPYVRVQGDSLDGHPHGGRDLAQPEAANRRVQVRSTDHPRTDRWVSLVTVRLSPRPIYRVGVVDGFSKPVQAVEEFPTLRRATNALNRLLNDWSKS
ncbi:hypothetical protein [Nocardioides sp.]|uniref:hypothetical protein n=1 Tax=Nocardioides sp. TaxID=35761 RepID=UPI003D095C42